MLAPRRATLDELGYVHEASYVANVAATAGKAGVSFDPDTRSSAGSFAASLLAAGGLLALVERIAAGEFDNGFALVRPPGHHAERGRAMGFCFFNNVAIAAEHLKRVEGLERILIVDWDLHHGNGTQHSFYRDPAVLYCSLHQYPYYPGSGSLDEVGAGAGEGFTINVPLGAGCGDGEYLDAFARVIMPVSLRFSPQFLLVSCGFDCHARDPLGGMVVSNEGFVRMARIVRRIAAECSGNRLALVLEGGYELGVLREAVPLLLEELSCDPPASEPPPPRPRVDVAGPVLDTVARYWKL